MTMEPHVRQRYSQGAQEVVPALCCPVEYDANLLALLPREIIERDYGCGDPSRYVQSGDTVLDLGSGTGKICYLAAQLVGPTGRVIGIDMNDDMLALARKYQPEMARKLGGDRVSFHKGRIQDLALDLEALGVWLAAHPVTDLTSLDAFEQKQHEMRRDSPMIPDASVDLVVSNCVLNLVDDAQKTSLIQEIYRVLKPGGRAAISDIVADAPVPQSLKQIPELWSGCISGAFEEYEFVKTFRDAGFTGMAFDKWDGKPWQIVGGIEFRSVTLTAVKQPVARQQTEGGHAVLYRGPFASIEDDLGNRFPVGERMAVSREVYERLGTPPFEKHFVRFAPLRAQLPTPYLVPPGTLRPAAVTRGNPARVEEIEVASACGPTGKGGRCC
ncbi:MAG: methyltransferase domain-containing protein [Magnetococcales bacterium]|nr:methyltransferase domain-containing protein [Magnetococcales bacterium]